MKLYRILAAEATRLLAAALAWHRGDYELAGLLGLHALAALFSRPGRDGAKPVATPERPYLSAGEVAKKFGVKTWEVSRCYERGFLQPVPRFGTHRLIPAADLPAVEAALREAGYLPVK